MNGITILPNDAPILPDVLLEYWAGIYHATPWLAARGVLFETFLRHPREILAIGLEAPLPIQERIGRAWREQMDPEPAIEHAVALLERRTAVLMASRRSHVTDGRAVEAMGHHTFHRAHRRLSRLHKPWRLGGA